MNYEEEKEMYSLVVTSQKNPVPTFDIESSCVFPCFYSDQTKLGSSCMFCFIKFFMVY